MLFSSDEWCFYINCCFWVDDHVSKLTMFPSDVSNKTINNLSLGVSYWPTSLKSSQKVALPVIIPCLFIKVYFFITFYYGISLLTVKIFHLDELFESYLLRNASNLNVATVPYIVQLVLFIKSRILFEVWSNHLNVSNLSEAEVGHKFKCNHPYKSQKPT